MTWGEFVRWERACAKGRQVWVARTALACFLCSIAGWLLAAWIFDGRWTVSPWALLGALAGSLWGAFARYEKRGRFYRSVVARYVSSGASPGR